MSAPYQEDKPAENAPTVEELQAQLASERGLRTQAESDRDREQARMDEWLRGTHDPATRVPPEEPLGVPPSPIEDPEAHQRWLLERDRRSQLELDRRFTEQTAQTEQRIDNASREARLWQQFIALYPAHAKRTELATTAFAKVARTEGLSKSDTELLSAVRNEMDSLVGKPIDKLDETDRTKELSGGDRPGPPKKKSTGPDDDDDTGPGITMHEAITKKQVEFGLI